MAGFSRRQMLREYAGELRILKVCLLSLFSAGVIFFWILYIQRPGHTSADVGLFVCLPLSAAGMILGLYLVVTGDAWLIRHTPFGRWLTSYGDPLRQMEGIDAQVSQAEAFDGVLLLPGWLIVFSQSATRSNPKRVCARPVPVKSLDAARLRADRDGGYWIRWQGREASFGASYFPGREDLEHALRWLQAQEIEASWSD